MPRKFLRRYLPSAASLREHWLFRRLGHRLHHPRLWYLNRRSVSGAAGLGLFIAFLPLPFQMLLAALGALWLRVNLPLAVGLIFITNPFTMGPVFYFCYKVGTWLLGAPTLTPTAAKVPGADWLFGQIAVIWQPLMIGSLLVGSISGLLGYWLVQLLWYRHVRQRRAALFRSLASR